LLRWFARGLASAQIARETGLDRKRVLRALALVRTAIRESAGTREGPDAEPVSSGEARRAMIGLRAAPTHVSAEVIPAREREYFRRVLAHEVTSTNGDGPAHEPVHERYSGIVYRGRLHRLNGRHRPFGQLESFWAYLRRHLGARGGIRPERLDLHLAELAWRFNHRRLAADEKARLLARLIRQPAGVANGTKPDAERAVPRRRPK
jgi:hypothetical protein